MDYNVFFQKLDGLLSDKKMDEAEEFLTDNIRQALEREDTQAILTVMSELVGLYRVTGKHELSTMFADKAMAIAQGAGLEGTQDYRVQGGGQLRAVKGAVRADRRRVKGVGLQGRLQVRLALQQHKSFVFGDRRIRTSKG